jgi:hypothetical protein
MRGQLLYKLFINFKLFFILHSISGQNIKNIIFLLILWVFEWIKGKRFFLSKLIDLILTFQQSEYIN